MSYSVECFAIRHKPTGKFMPCRMFKQSGHGWSWWEPTETRAGYVAFDQNPRVFFSRRAASNAIGQWLRGPLNRREVDYGSQDCSAPWSPSEIGFEVMSAKSEHPPRRRDDVEIVTMWLAELLKMPS